MGGGGHLTRRAHAAQAPQSQGGEAGAASSRVVAAPEGSGEQLTAFPSLRVALVNLEEGVFEVRGQALRA